MDTLFFKGYFHRIKVEITNTLENLMFQIIDQLINEIQY